MDTHPLESKERGYDRIVVHRAVPVGPTSLPPAARISHLVAILQLAWPHSLTFLDASCPRRHRRCHSSLSVCSPCAAQAALSPPPPPPPSFRSFPSPLPSLLRLAHFIYERRPVPTAHPTRPLCTHHKPTSPHSRYTQIITSQLHSQHALTLSTTQTKPTGQATPHARFSFLQNSSSTHRLVFFHQPRPLSFD